MSFRYKDKEVTTKNYKDIFGSYPVDILDEIRLAIADNTEIARYIDICGTDSYKLNQLRLAIREGVEKEFLNPAMTGRTLYLIRQGLSMCMDMTQILRYVNRRGLLIDADSVELIAEFMVIGTDVSMINFNYVRKDCIKLICTGLYKGYPMWVCIGENINLEKHKLKSLMTGMQLGIDIHPFIDNNWTVDQMDLLFASADKVDINELLGHISEKFPVESLRTIIDLKSKDLSVNRLFTVDEDGYPVYSQYQMESLGKAIESGTISEDMYNSSLSDMAIEEMHEARLKKKKRKLKASLTGLNV